VVQPSVIQPTEIAPPEDMVVHPPSEAVILRPEATEDTIRQLSVKRRIPLASLRTNPQLVLGNATLDMKPVFDNPASLLNLADRLRSEPALAASVSDRAEVLEVEQGLLIRQFLSYQPAPAACGTSSGRGRMARTGTDCFVRLADAQRAGQFSDSASPRFVADPAKRAQAIATARAEAEQEQADLSAGIAEFRARMKDPVQRAQIESELPAGEAARLSALGDTQLAAELVNTAETQIEDIMFIPKADRLDGIRGQMGLVQPPRSVLQLPENVDAEHALAEHVFLTGFTLGRMAEWRRRVSITVKTCVVGCKRTYYLELFAGAGYGFGLRFPLRLGGLYAYHRVGDEETASIAPVFLPINGSETDFAEAGLASDQLFRGQELVAELNAYAGMNYKVPFHSGGVTERVGPNLADSLPPPYANGQFTPPAPGDSPLGTKVVLDSPDLLGGLANYGVAGAKILPAFEVGLRSDRLRFLLTDNLTGEQREVETSGQSYPLQVDPSDHSSSFSIGYPEYDLAFQITPGLAARLFVDVAVWSKNWDWPVWFPQISVTLPPDGLTFSCHANTVCSRAYRYSPSMQEEEVESYGEAGTLLEREVDNWQRRFRNQWYKQCPSLPLMFCELGISSLAETTGNTMLNEMGELPEYPSMDSAKVMITRAREADRKAEAIILDSKVASIGQYGKSLFAAYEAVWNEGCTDQLCRDRIHALGVPYVAALEARQEASPDAERNQLVFLENTQGGWSAKAKQEVEASKGRTIRLRPGININRPR
jgi:hypothetical protein